MASRPNALSHHTTRHHVGPPQKRLSRKELITATVVVVIFAALTAFSVGLFGLHGSEPELINNYWPILP